MNPDYNDLQKQMLRSAKFDEPLNRALSLCGLGIGGEASEISDLIKKVFYHGHAFNREKFIEEGGDLIWYPAYLCHVLDFDFEAIMTGPRPIDNVIYFADAPMFTRIALKLTNFAGHVAFSIDWLVFEHQESLESYKPILERHLVFLISWLNELAIALQSSLEEMCQVNIQKLLKRYPNGFSTEASLARVDAV